MRFTNQDKQNLFYPFLWYARVRNTVIFVSEMGEGENSVTSLMDAVSKSYLFLFNSCAMNAFMSAYCTENFFVTSS